MHVKLGSASHITVHMHHVLLTANSGRKDVVFKTMYFFFHCLLTNALCPPQTNHKTNTNHVILEVLYPL